MSIKPFSPIDSVAIFLWGFVLYLVYNPVLSASYLYHDDFYIINWNHTRLEEHPQFRFSIHNGRPFLAFIESFLFSFVYHIKDGFIFFLLGFLILLFCGLFIYVAASKSMSRFLAVLVTTLVLTLPPFQVLTSWGSLVTCFTAIIFSVLAAFAIGNLDAISSFARAVWIKWLAIVFLFVAFGIHQQIAMFYWVMASLEMMAVYEREGWKRFLSRSGLFAEVFLGALCLYILLLICCYHVMPSQANMNYDVYHFNFDFLERIKWFWDRPLYLSLNLWVYPPNHVMSSLVLTLLFWAGAKMTLKIWHEHRDWKAILPLFLGTFLIVIGYLPILISQINHMVYRTFLVMTPLLLIFIIWGFKNESRAFKTILLVVTISACTQANITLKRHIVLPRESELRYIIGTFKSLSHHRSYVIQEVVPMPTEGDNGDEYDNLTSFFVQDRINILRFGLWEAGLPIENFTFDLEDTCSKKDIQGGPLSNRVIFDFNKILLADNPHHFDCRY